MYNSARVRPLLTNTLTRQCVLLALTKPFTPFYRATRHHARIRLIAAVGDDGCCYCCCCCCCCDAADVVADGCGGGGLPPQPLGALLAQQAAIAVKGLTPTPSWAAVASATWTISPRSGCRPSSTCTGCTTGLCGPFRTPCGTFCSRPAFGGWVTGANGCCPPSPGWIPT